MIKNLSYTLREARVEDAPELVKADNADKVDKIQINVRETNENAIGLYKKLGFTEEGRLLKKIKISDDYYLDDLVLGPWVKK